MPSERAATSSASLTAVAGWAMAAILPLPGPGVIQREKSSRFLVRCGQRSCVRLWSARGVEYRPELGDDDVQRGQLALRPGEDQRAFQVGDHQQCKAGCAGGGNAEGD